jgi:hypothetical protein
MVDLVAGEILFCGMRDLNLESLCRLRRKILLMQFGIQVWQRLLLDARFQGRSLHGSLVVCVLAYEPIVQWAEASKTIANWAAQRMT